MFLKFKSIKNFKLKFIKLYNRSYNIDNRNDFIYLNSLELSYNDKDKRVIQIIKNKLSKEIEDKIEETDDFKFDPIYNYNNYNDKNNDNNDINNNSIKHIKHLIFGATDDSESDNDTNININKDKYYYIEQRMVNSCE